jgi:hypothetical protein
MNLLQTILGWFQTPAAPAAAQPTWGDRLLQVAGAYIKSKSTEAQTKANAAKASAPADNSPGATAKKSDAPLGQSLLDLLKSNGQA